MVLVISEQGHAGRREAGLMALPHMLELRLLCEGADFYFALGVAQWAELGGDATGDGGGFTGVLEAGEVRPIPPGEGTAQTLAGADGGVMDGVDQPFIIGRALRVAREVSEIAAGRE